MDITQKIQQFFEQKEEDDFENMDTAQEFIKKIKESIFKKDSTRRFFHIEFYPVGDNYDEGMVIMKFASAMSNDDHNTIMKEAPTKLMISVEGFNRKGKVNGNIKADLFMFQRMKGVDEGRGVFSEIHEKHKVDKTGTLKEIAKHLIGYFNDNLSKFTDMSPKFTKRSDKSEEIKETGIAVGAGAVAGTMSSPEGTGTQIQGPDAGAEEPNQDTMVGIARFKRKLGCNCKNDKKCNCGIEKRKIK